MAEQPKRALILGHSYIRRLGNYCSHPRQRNLALDPHEYTVSFHGIGGARVAALWDELGRIAAQKPDVLILQIGGNDLSTSRAENVAHNIIQFVEYVAHHFDIAKIFVCELLPRISVPHFTHHYNFVAVPCTNEILRAHFKFNQTQSIPQARFWYHGRGLCTLRPDYYLPDGIHLNDRGMYRYFKSIRGAVLALAQ